jgi:hypothetical protein
LADGALDTRERTVEIGRHDMPPLLDRHVERQRARPGSRVVHEDIQAIEAIGRLIDDIPAAGQFRAGCRPRAVRIGVRTPGERRSAWPSASGRLHEVVDAQIRIVDAPPVRR